MRTWMLLMLMLMLMLIYLLIGVWSRASGAFREILASGDRKALGVCSGRCSSFDQVNGARVDTEKAKRQLVLSNVCLQVRHHLAKKGRVCGGWWRETVRVPALSILLLLLLLCIDRITCCRNTAFACLSKGYNKIGIYSIKTASHISLAVEPLLLSISKKKGIICSIFGMYESPLLGICKQAEPANAQILFINHAHYCALIDQPRDDVLIRAKKPSPSIAKEKETGKEKRRRKLSETPVELRNGIRTRHNNSCPYASYTFRS